MLWSGYDMLLECTVLEEASGENYRVDSLKTIFEMIPETYMVEFFLEAEFFYLIWTVKYFMQFLIWVSSQLIQFLNNPHNWTI